jgi:glucose/arabinose dehydrogenase
VASPPETVGPNPTIAPVDTHLVPSVQFATAKGWPAGAKPQAANGITVTAFASGLHHPRWLYVLPNGDVLVAETNAPGRGAVYRIVLLRDGQGDGVADTRSVFIANLDSPFGMALVGSNLYVADSDAILKFPYKTGDTTISAHGEKLTDLPAGPINHHWTKNIIASADGKSLYATTGSNSNAGENGIAAETGRAAIYQVDLATGAKQLFATGLRNPNGMAWEPNTGVLWTVVNERDNLGNDLVPDYLTSVKQGAFYGFPYSYFGQHVDERVTPPRPDLVAKAISPDYALGAHVAPLGLVVAGKTSLPAPFANGMFIGEHGSWNRQPPVGYKVVFVPFAGGKPSGRPVDVLTGFLNSAGEAYGRPVGVAIDGKGALLVADDVGNAIWRAAGTAP